MPRPRKFNEVTAVRAARDVFRRRGYAATSLSDLSETTGLGKGSIYNTFGDKETIYRRAFHDYCQESIATSDAIFANADSGIETAFGYVRQIIDETVADTEHMGCMIAKATTERVPESPAVLEEADNTLRHMQELLRSSVLRGRAAGQVENSLDADRLSLLILCVTRGIEALGKAGYEANELQGIESITRQLIDGYTPPSAAA